MVSELGSLQDVRGEVHVALVTFGGDSKLLCPLTPADQLQLPELQAGGKTPLGSAIDLVRALLEDESEISSRAFAPSVVLLSDGAPTDLPDDLKERVIRGEIAVDDYLSWGPLKSLRASPRCARAQRLALAIGTGEEGESTHAVLEAFVNTPGIPVIRAADAGGIARFLRWVTLSVATRTRSRDPNTPVLPALSPFDNDEIIF